MCGERLLRSQLTNLRAQLTNLQSHLTNLRSQLTNLRYRNLILAICGPCAVSAFCAGVTVKKWRTTMWRRKVLVYLLFFEHIGSQAIKYLFFDYRWDHEYRPGLEALLC